MKKYKFLEQGIVATKEELQSIDLAEPIYVKQMNLRNMWDNGFTGKGITVAIIDSGCDVNNELIKDKIKHVCNMTEDDDANPDIVTDYLGHGTHVAGLIAGDNFENKFMGIAPDVELLIYKVIDKSGIASYSTIARAIYASVQRGAEIINISLGGEQPAPEIHEAIKDAMKLNVSVIGSSGNGGDDTSETIELMFPACYEEVIQVGSIDEKKKPSSFSNSNQFVDCVALGTNVLSLYKDNTFKSLSGTSQSAPLVTGALALLKEWSHKEYGRRLSEVEIYSLLIKNTKSIPNIDRNSQGHGYIYLNPYIKK